MINNLYEISRKERTKAIKLYAKSIINLKISSEIYPLQKSVSDYCQENDYMENDEPLISLEVFPQINHQYYFGLCTAPSKKGNEVANKFESKKSLIAWDLFCISKNGIDCFLKRHQQLIKEIGFYSDFNINTLYNLSEYLKNFDYEKVGEQIDCL